MHLRKMPPIINSSVHMNCAVSRNWGRGGIELNATNKPEIPMY